MIKINQQVYILNKLLCICHTYRNSWLKSLEQNTNATKTPADNLLFELNVKMCTIGILYTLLRDCELGNVLSVLHYPGIYLSLDSSESDDIL